MGDVGYKKPPKEYQFKPGQSGNPKGMKRGVFNIKTMAKRMMEDPNTWKNLPVSKEQIRKLREQVGTDKSFGYALVIAWMSKAMTDHKFAAIVQDILDGKGKQEVDLGDSLSLFTAGKLVIEEKKPVDYGKPDTTTDAQPEAAPSDQAATGPEHS